MRCSANEIMTLMSKAARGAGAPPAQAAEFGAAALSHLAAGCESADLAAALTALPGGPILDIPVKITQKMEAAEQDVVAMRIKPGPFAGLELSYLYARPFAVKAKTTDSDIHAEMFLSIPRKPPPMPRVDIPDDLFAQMQQLAAKTFVPESTASRLSGAGAGLTDND